MKNSKLIAQKAKTARRAQRAQSALSTKFLIAQLFYKMIVIVPVDSKMLSAPLDFSVLKCRKREIFCSS